MFHYFILRSSLQILCYAYSLPLALFFTFAFSPVGTWSWSLLLIIFVSLTAMVWIGLEFHLRRLDRLRGGSDSIYVFLRQGKRLVGQIKRQTKAQLLMCDEDPEAYLAELKRSHDNPCARDWHVMPPDDDGWFIALFTPVSMAPCAIGYVK